MAKNSAPLGTCRPSITAAENFSAPRCETLPPLAETTMSMPIAIGLTLIFSVGVRQFLHGRARLLAVVEVVLQSADDLIVLVPLAGDDHRVARPRLGDGQGDRLAPVHLAEKPPGHPRLDHLQDRARL